MLTNLACSISGAWDYIIDTLGIIVQI